jgi:hypothetical protein
VTRGLRQYLVGLLLLATLAGCGGYFGHEERAAWRGDAERRCFAAGLIQKSDFMVVAREVDGPGTCGMDRPIYITAVAQGAVAMKPQATLACPATAAFEGWLANVVQPAAMQWFGQQVVAVHQMSTYACRPRNNQRGAKVSEHAFGNAIDVGGFTLADGREIKVVSGWNGAVEEQGFFHAVHAGACGRFRTVLGPGSDRFHYNHIHLDLALHDARGARSYCRPKPAVPEEQPVYTSSIGGQSPAPMSPAIVPQAYQPIEDGLLPQSHESWPRLVDPTDE